MANNKKKDKSKGSEISRKKEKKEEKKVKFIVQTPEAKENFLAGEFNYRDRHSLPLKKEKEEHGARRFDWPLAVMKIKSCQIAAGWRKVLVW